MFKVCAESVFLSKSFRHRLKKVFITIYSFTALAAYQVVMMPFLGMVINRFIVRFTFKYALILFKNFQRAINGGLVDPGKFTVYMVNNFLGREMVAFIMDEIQDYFTRLSKPEPFIL
jgi:hypothetical protein